MNEQQPPANKIKNPEDFTDEELDKLAPVLIPVFERGWSQDHTRLIAASTEAASNQDRAALQATLHDAKAVHSWVSRWADRLGDRTSANHKALLEAFEHLCADITAALYGELPGQQPPHGEGDEWKGR